MDLFNNMNYQSFLFTDSSRKKRIYFNGENNSDEPSVINSESLGFVMDNLIGSAKQTDLVPGAPNVPIVSDNTTELTIRPTKIKDKKKIEHTDTKTKNKSV